MSGFYAPYIPGWDTHGLPIEQVLAKQGVKRKEMDLVEYLKLCREYALSQVDKQREDFKRLGVSGDWENPYVTLTPDYEAAQIRVFGEMAKKGYIYRGAKPVYWSWSSESALAEAEIEYHDLLSTSLYYANRVKDGKGVLDTDTYIVVWTTTPFTITASRGLTVGADIDYVLVQPAGESRKFVVASELLNSLSEKFGWADVQVLATYRGQELNHIVTVHPWDTAVDELVILGDHVTTDSGTGIVHTAPGFGEDDYNVGVANGLEVAVTVNERGIMMEMLVLNLRVSSMTRLCRLLSKNWVIYSLLRKKFHTHTHLTGVPRNQSSGELFHSGLLLYLNSAKKSWMKLKK